MKIMFVDSEGSRIESDASLLPPGSLITGCITALLEPAGGEPVLVVEQIGIIPPAQSGMGRSMLSGAVAAVDAAARLALPPLRGSSPVKPEAA
jgi:hypothetical protein